MEEEGLKKRMWDRRLEGILGIGRKQCGSLREKNNGRRIG